MARIPIIPLIVLLSGVLVGSCVSMDYNKSNDSYYMSYDIPRDAVAQEAVVTVKTAGGEMFLQINDATRALVINQIDKKLAGCRAFADFVVAQGKDMGSGYDLRVYVNWIRAIQMGVVGSSSEYAGPNDVTSSVSDRIDILDSTGMTSLEDGFLTIHYSVRMGGEVEHGFSLVFGGYDDPFEADLVHDANSDSSDSLQEGLVAFDLRRIPGGEDAQSLKLHYISNSGERLLREFVRNTGTN